jgi:hypothetical protein
VGEGPLRAQVRTAEDLGSEVFVHVAVDHLGGQVALVSKMQPPFSAEPGENVALQITGTTNCQRGRPPHRIRPCHAPLRSGDHRRNRKTDYVYDALKSFGFRIDAGLSGRTGRPRRFVVRAHGLRLRPGVRALGARHWTYGPTVRPGSAAAS